MKDFNEELLNFLNGGTCAFTCMEYIRKILKDNGYVELDEREVWVLDKTKYFVVRNDTSIIAFNLSENLRKQFSIVSTHLDTPSFLIKPKPEYYENGYLKLNVAPYGGILNYGFMDRPLGIAGRIIIKDGNHYIKKIIDTKSPVAIIPSIAIHQNDKANSNLDLNTEVDLMPIISLDKNYSLDKLLKDTLKIDGKIFDYDLFLYVVEKAQSFKDFIASPRLDNLTCTYAALKAFINNFGDSINVLTIFNNEEIGSNTLEGADSNFLIDTLKKICGILDLDLATSLANSLIINADNAHAKHPNHDELSDHTNTPTINDGVIIMKEINGTTNSISSTIFKHILEENKIPYKNYTSRNDFATGSTLANTSLRHLSIYSLDVGMVMLAMHSGLELIGNKDSYYLYEALQLFYEVNYKIENNKISFL